MHLCTILLKIKSYEKSWFNIYPDDPDLIADNISLEEASELAKNSKKKIQDVTLIMLLSKLIILNKNNMSKSTISFICTIIQILCVFIVYFIYFIDKPYIAIGITIFQIILLIYQIIIIIK